jgi:transcriptional regulator with XRE-family HTH domain
MTGRALRAWRESKGYSMSDLSRLLRIDIGEIDKWEKGIKKVPTFLQVRLNSLEQQSPEGEGMEQ